MTGLFSVLRVRRLVVSHHNATYYHCLHNPNGFIEFINPENSSTDVTWVRADVPDETHRAMKVYAARTDRRIEEVAAEVLEAHFSDYDTDGTNNNE